MPEAAPESRDLLQETHQSERRRVTVLAFVFGALALVFPVAALVAGSPLALAISSGALAFGVAYQLLLRRVLAHLAKTDRRAPMAARYANTLAEALIASAQVAAASLAFGPDHPVAARASLVYLLFVGLSALRLNAGLCLFAGLGAALGCLAVRLGFGTPVAPALLEAALVFAGGVLTAIVTVEIRRRILERERVLSVFGQHVSPAVADHLVGLEEGLGGERRFVCVMFLDIRNFTTFSEKRSPEEVVSFLNALFGPMVETVNRHQGIINKFLGDGFMAVFGAPLADPQECTHAVAAAREILAGVEAQVRAGALPETRVGLGLHAGDALTGTVGSAARKEYTLIGDVVNLASRIEALNKSHGAQLLVSETVAARIDAAGATSLGLQQVKGREAPVEVFKLA